MRSWPGIIGVVLCGAQLCGCASTEEVREQKILMRVALIPVRAKPAAEIPSPQPADAEAAANAEPAANAETADASEPAFHLSIDPSTLTAAIQRELGACFTSVVVLDPPSDFADRPDQDKEEWLGSDAAKTHWARRALENDADLVFDCQLNYEVNVVSGTNDKFFLNLPLFLLGGPFNYFINDRTYEVKAELEAQVYDLSLFGGMQNMRDLVPKSTVAQIKKAAILKTIPCSLTRVDLDFLDRAGSSDPGAFALSLVCPSGWLSPESDKARTTLSQQSVEALATDLAAQVRQDSFDLDGWVARREFRLDPKTVRTTRIGNAVEFEGEVVYKKDESARLEGAAFEAGAGMVTSNFDQPSKSGPEERYKLKGRVPLGGSDSEVRLRIWQADAEKNARTYTIPIEWPVNPSS